MIGSIGVRRARFAVSVASVAAVATALVLIAGTPAASAAEGLSGVSSTAAIASDAGVSAAPDAARFDPGYIISDANFYAGNAMTAAQVQSFLESKVTSCPPGSLCLRNLRVDTWDIAATPMCTTYRGAAQESAATIIAKVGQACGVSQAALLVMLQKEQSLVTAASPSLDAVSAAMGVGCYDDGQPCVGQYAGFFNQLFNGAYLLKRYTQPPGTGAGTEYYTRFDLSYPVGATSQILYNPNRGCGTVGVTIRNQATHALYIYTPYTPNAAALNNLYGLGDSCSSYGNRNFWRIYSDWFGDPLASRVPIGWLDSVGVVGSRVTARGWTIDPDVTSAIPVELVIDGVVVATGSAGVPYPGLDAVHPEFGSGHGFVLSASTTTGVHRVCVNAKNDAIGGDRIVGCKDVGVSTANAPIGWLDGVTVAGHAVTVVGWAIDGDTTDPVDVEISVDGLAQRVTADQTRPGFDRSFPGFGDDHGFSASLDLSDGSHTICVTALDATDAQAVRPLGCRTLTVTTNNAPLGWLDGFQMIGNDVTARGWTIDPDTVASVQVRVLVDGEDAGVFVADQAYPGLGDVWKGFGDDHGFAPTVTVPNGVHEVCISAINDGAGGDRTIGCRNLTITASNVPIGWLDAMTIENQVVTASGWAIDPDTRSAIEVEVTVDGVARTRATAGEPYPGLGGPHPGYGDDHRFVASLSIPLGSRDVCVVALNDREGASRTLGCRQLVSRSAPPIGWLDSVSVFGPVVTAQGWTIDSDTVDPVRVTMTIDGLSSVTSPADVAYPGLEGPFPTAGNLHGFVMSQTSTVGQHIVCLTAVNNATGPDRELGCRTVTVAASSQPIGWLDGVDATTAQVTPVGWAIDPDLIGPAEIAVTVDGVAVFSGEAAVARPGLGGVFRGFGDDHGFAPAIPVSPGTREVCVMLIDNSGLPDRSIGCRSVLVP